MKKIIVLLLFVLISCGKKSSVHDEFKLGPRPPRGPDGKYYPVPSDWDHGHNWQGNYNYPNFWTDINGGRWSELNSYWTTYQRYSFYYVRYTCSSGIFSICRYQTVGQGGKEFFNVYSKVSSELRHPYGNTFQKVFAGIQGILTPFGAAFTPQFVQIGYAENGLNYWMFESTDKRTRFGINPAYPIWANPVFQEEIDAAGNKTGYYLNYWIYTN